MGSWGPPAPLRHELARPFLAARLARRWSVPVTTVVAGAGFGKSTLLAQALRAEAAAPVGIDGWVSCRPGHERDVDLAAGIVGAIGGPSSDADPLAAVLGALRAAAPVDVCIVIDDVHLLGGESTATRLLGDVVRRLPANAHLVLAGREPPPIPLARLRAADQRHRAHGRRPRVHLSTRSPTSPPTIGRDPEPRRRIRRLAGAGARGAGRPP